MVDVMVGVLEGAQLKKDVGRRVRLRMPRLLKCLAYVGIQFLPGSTSTLTPF